MTDQLNRSERDPERVNESIRLLQQRRGLQLFKNGSIAAATTQKIDSIPDSFAYLVLHLAGVSSDTATRQPLIRVSTDNGATFDATAGNYVGRKVTGTTFTALSLGSLIESATVTAAQTFTVSIYIFGYQGGTNPWASARIISNTVEYECSSRYIGSTSPINALRLLWDASGSFDAGTFALYGAG